MAYVSDLTVTGTMAYVSDLTVTGTMAMLVTLLLQLPWPMLVTLLLQLPWPVLVTVLLQLPWPMFMTLLLQAPQPVLSTWPTPHSTSWTLPTVSPPHSLSRPACLLPRVNPQELSVVLCWMLPLRKPCLPAHQPLQTLGYLKLL